MQRWLHNSQSPAQNENAESLFKKQAESAINGTYKDFPFFFLLSLNLSWCFYSYVM